MKTLKGIFPIAILICWSNCNGIAAQPVKSSAEGFVFTHPGLLNSMVNDKAQTVSVIKPGSNPKS